MRSSRSTTSLFLALISLMLLWSLAASAQGQLAVVQRVIHPEAVTSGVTIRTKVTVGQEQRTSDQGIWLAGFATERDGAPTALALTLSRVGSGWLGPMWGVQLISDQGLLPNRLAPRSGNGFSQGAMYFSLLTTPLAWEHEFEVAFGYDPQSGLASISVFDLTTEEWVITRNLQLEPHADPLYAAAGVAGPAGVGEPPLGVIDAFSVDAGVRPSRVSWWIMQRERDGVPYATVQRIDRRLETVISAHLPWESLPGTMQLRLLDAAGATVLTVLGVGEEEYVSIPVDGLAAGAYTAVLEYSYGGQVWELDTRPITVGLLELQIAEVGVGERVGAEAAVEGILRIETDGPLEALTVGISGQLVRHTFEWEPDGRRGRTQKAYTGDLFVVDAVGVQPDGSLSVPFSGTVAIPQGDEGTGWELELEPWALPEHYLVPVERADVWVVEPERELPWLGFLDDEEAEVVEWVPGVTVVTLSGEIEAGPLDMYLVAIDVTRPELSFDALVGSQPITEAALWPRDHVGEMVKASGAIMGINSAFFAIRDTQHPNGLVIQSGKLLKSGSANVIAIDSDGAPYLGNWLWMGTMQRADGSASRSVVGMNEKDMGAGIGLYRWPAIRTPGTALLTSVELVLTDVVEEDDPSSLSRVMRGVVSEVRQNQPPVALEPGMAVLGGSGSNGLYLRENFAVGDEVQVVYQLVGSAEGGGVDDWRDIRAAVSGGVVLLRHGDIGDTAVLTNKDRHPRTAVGISEDRSTLYWLVVDGRSIHSVGVTYQEMADYFQHIGAYWAMNLDGGGSSTLAAWDFDLERVTILNVPSDGGQRYVPDGLGLFYTPQ